MLLRLRALISERKWVLWVAVAVVLIAAWWIGVSLLPHHVVNQLVQYEEKSNNVGNYR
jgi:hypothetical protein